MDKKQQAIYDLMKVTKETAIFFDFDNKEETIARCERAMEHLKPGSTKTNTFTDIFDEILSSASMDRRAQNLADIVKKADENLKRDGKGPLASDYFKDM